jgi:hypothetical protein
VFFLKINGKNPCQTKNAPYICTIIKTYIMYNKKVIAVLAKNRVRFEAMCGNVITLEEAIAFESEKIARLQKADTSRY